MFGRASHQLVELQARRAVARRVAALGHQQREPDVGLGEVRDRRVSQLMQRPPARRCAEQLLRAAVGQPRPPRHRTQIRGRRHPRWRRPAIRQEQRATRPPRDQTRQQSRGAGLQVQPLDIAGLGPHASALVLQLEILDVQRQHLPGPRRGLIQQPPQRLLAHRDVITTPEPLELHERDRPRPVRRLPPTRQHIGKRLAHPSLTRAESRERAQGRDVTIPRRRRATTPRPDCRPLELLPGHPPKRALRPKVAAKPTKRLRVGTATGGREIGLGEERVDGLREARGLLPRRAQPPARPPPRTHRRECVVITGCGGDASADGR